MEVLGRTRFILQHIIFPVAMNKPAYKYSLALCEMFENVTIETLSTPSEETLLLNAQNYLGVTPEEEEIKKEVDPKKWTLCMYITSPCWCPVCYCFSLCFKL